MRYQSTRSQRITTAHTEPVSLVTHANPRRTNAIGVSHEFSCPEVWFVHRIDRQSGWRTVDDLGRPIAMSWCRRKGIFTRLAG